MAIESHHSECYNGGHPAGRRYPRGRDARARGGVAAGASAARERDSAMRWMARGLLLLVLASSLACTAGGRSGAGAAQPGAPDGRTSAAPGAAPSVASAGAAAAAAPSGAQAEWE